jgi:hypothetical protein
MPMHAFAAAEVGYEKIAGPREFYLELVRALKKIRSVARDTVLVCHNGSSISYVFLAEANGYMEFDIDQLVHPVSWPDGSTGSVTEVTDDMTELLVSSNRACDEIDEELTVCIQGCAPEVAAEQMAGRLLSRGFFD